MKNGTTTVRHSRTPLVAVLRLTAACAWLMLAGCAAARGPQGAPPAPGGTDGAATAEAALPAGPGRTILEKHCTWCHDLREVTKFRGYYNREQWRDIVVTMVEYGAALEPGDVTVLTGYLEEHLGRR